MLRSVKRKISFTSGNDSGLKSSVVGLVLVALTFIWYLYGSRLLNEVTSSSAFSSSQTVAVWGMNILGTVASAVFGFLIVRNFEKRTTFFRCWFAAGIALSLMPLIVDITQLLSMILFFTFVGVYFGLGMPVCLSYFASVTKETNRSRLGGLTFLTIFGGVVLLGLVETANPAANAIVLASCPIIGLLVLFKSKLIEKIEVQIHSGGSYVQIFSNKAFLLYFVPWIMFAVANFISLPIVSQIFPSLFEQSMLIENLIAAIFAVIGGFFGDYVGRRRLVVAGFVLLGFGYASLGLFPQNYVGWCFYTAVDGIAWGIFYTIFLMTIWGDISHGVNSEKYYAVGYLPFLFSIFTELSVGNMISSTVNAAAIFSFISIFLFLAVLPLAYAPETLPQKLFESRELAKYVEQAQRAKLRSKSH